METQFTPCQACGAVGEVGKNCQFCGTTIVLKEGTISLSERIPKVRTVTPQQYAEKISIYQNVEGSRNSSNLMYVSIGVEEGLINLNGDLIYPLQHEYYIYIISDTVIFLSMRNEGRFRNLLDDSLLRDDTNTLNEFYTKLRSRQKFYGTLKELYENIREEIDFLSSYEHGMFFNLKTNEKFDNVYTEFSCEYYVKKDGKNVGLFDPVKFKVRYFNESIKDICKKINIDKNLLARIKEYIQEVKENPDCNKYYLLYFNKRYPIFTITNNTTDDILSNILSNELGVSLYASPVNMADGDDEVFENCELYDSFEEVPLDDEEEEYVGKYIYDRYINFCFDAESLCAVVQYLAECYGCPSDEIKLKDYTIDNTDSNSDSLSNSNSDKNESLLYKIMETIAIVFFLGGSIFLFACFFSSGEIMSLIGAILGIGTLIYVAHRNGY